SAPSAIGVRDQEGEVFAYALAPLVGVLLIESGRLAAAVVYFLDIGFATDSELRVFVGRKQDGGVDQHGDDNGAKLEGRCLYKKFPLFVPDGMIKFERDQYQQGDEQVIGHLDVVGADLER